MDTRESSQLIGCVRTNEYISVEQRKAEAHRFDRLQRGLLAPAA
jgi:hypothetical protein